MNPGWWVSANPLLRKSNELSFSSGSFQMPAHRLASSVDGFLLIDSHIQLCTGEIPTPLLLLPLHISEDGQVTGDTESSTLTTRSTVTRIEGARRQRKR